MNKRLTALFTSFLIAKFFMSLIFRYKNYRSDLFASFWKKNGLLYKLALAAIIITIISCNKESSSNMAMKDIDTTINETGRLLPKKLRYIPFAITAAHYPNPCYAEFENGKYVWKHNTTVTANKNLNIVEYGSFVYSSKGWYLRVVYTPKDFDEHYGTKNGELKNGVVYSDPSSWRMSDSLFAGDAMWYYIAKDNAGNLFKGVAPIETEGIKLADGVLKKGYKRFSKTLNKINWTGYGEIGNYALSGTLNLSNGIYEINNDTLKHAELVFNMQSISSEEKSLENHLKSEDFFDCNRYPTSEFILTKPIFLKDKNLVATGVLTIKGVSNEIAFPIQHTFINDTLSLGGNVSFDRTTFNIKYNSKNFFSNIGDQAIKDKVDISFSLKGI
jgi:polyisoprenoid-binding protein YceI